MTFFHTLYTYASSYLYWFCNPPFSSAATQKKIEEGKTILDVINTLLSLLAKQRIAASRGRSCELWALALFAIWISQWKMEECADLQLIASYQLLIENYLCLHPSSSYTREMKIDQKRIIVIFFCIHDKWWSSQKPFLKYQRSASSGRIDLKEKSDGKHHFVAMPKIEIEH